MPDKRNNGLIGIISAIIAIILTIVIMYGVSVYGDKNKESVDKTKYLDTAYVEKIFEDSYVHEIDIQIPEINWEYMIEHALEEAYVICDVVIDGELIENVSIRPKGNSSLDSIANAGDDHFSFKIEFDHYNKNNTYYGLDKLVLNNLSQDVSCMKEWKIRLPIEIMVMNLAIYISLNVLEWPILLLKYLCQVICKADCFN